MIIHLCQHKAMITEIEFSTEEVEVKDFFDNLLDNGWDVVRGFQATKYYTLLRGYEFEPDFWAYLTLSFGNYAKLEG